MILNGIVFFPPSEFIYFDAYFVLGGDLKYSYAALPLANSIGHFILFEISRVFSDRLISFERRPQSGIVSSVFQYTLRISRQHFRFHDRHAWAVLYGRCVPIVHTGISVVAGISGVPRLRYFVLTIAGNVIFSLVCWLIVAILSTSDNYARSIVLVAVFFSTIYTLHLLVERRIRRQ